MLVRRQVLIGGGGGFAVLGSALVPGRANGADTLSFSHKAPLCLIDSLIEGATDIASAAAESGAPVVHFAGDIGAPWLDHLEPAWRRDPLPVIGATYAGAFFCLEQLARSNGLTCTFRFFLPMSRQGGSVHPFAAEGQSVSSNEAAHGARIGALFSSALRVAALGPDSRRKPVIPDEDAAGDRPLIWLLQPNGARRRAG